MTDTTITLHLNEPSATISPYLHGHFVEHLGACIYNGIWVGEDSSIPHTNGIRRDVVDALQKI